mmetsp:Transcript_10730/g.17424  ORF Transcript_10730/g.17424 Transcript_10730/m.17424 type:complete len:198 (-) Transcript_10730:134-727(-)
MMRKYMGFLCNRLSSFSRICRRPDVKTHVKPLAFSTTSTKAPKRFAGVVKLKPEMYNQYTRLHDHTWDEVMKRMYDSNMRNFVVYYHKETSLMFHHWEYVGSDFDGDMKAISDDEVVRKWWSFCEPCQEPFKWEGPPPSKGGDGGPDGSWWAPMEEVNHCGAWPVAYSSEFPDPDFVPKNPEGKTSSSTETDGLVQI